MKRLLLLTLAVTLMGQDCEPTEPPPEGGNEYCQGNEYTIWDSIVDGVAGFYNTIIGGEESADRRSTVQVLFGSAYCSGTVINARTVLTAGHCGYASSTVHTARIEGDPKTYVSNEHLVHPDYLKYVANPADREARKADLMLVYFEEDLPGPYLGDFYSAQLASQCRGLAAQGYGQDGDGRGGTLREAKYIITEDTGKLLVSRLAPEGKICFGDSGGPLYADVNGRPMLAGVTTTTMSQDCLTGGSHVNVGGYPDFTKWVVNNLRR